MSRLPRPYACRGDRGRSPEPPLDADVPHAGLCLHNGPPGEFVELGESSLHGSADPWLQAWLPLLRDRAGAAPILELGCGIGKDTAILVEAGFRVVAVDLSPRAIERARAAVPQAEFHIMDLRAPFPVTPTGVGVIIASLSLHYFAWTETLALVERIRTTLRPRGALLCRLNSTNDHHYGAIGYPRIEENFYLVQGEPKRFFDQTSIEAVFATGWRMLSVAERLIKRYAQPKAVWEVILERDA
ncbi:MAG: class I SAM-dependent methyltransferase [Betaproteobacteria bacterium]